MFKHLAGSLILTKFSPFEQPTAETRDTNLSLSLSLPHTPLTLKTRLEIYQTQNIQTQQGAHLTSQQALKKHQQQIDHVTLQRTLETSCLAFSSQI